MVASVQQSNCCDKGEGETNYLEQLSIIPIKNAIMCHLGIKMLKCNAKFE